ncbi:UTRA domain-containing protein, partial [Pseudomonas aeruginosa]|uniref:UTRA domain-containing protein n=1 Tax=Pseudomonas aeruginosa TaxID=287 RepID=UPI0039A3CEDD
AALRPHPPPVPLCYSEALPRLHPGAFPCGRPGGGPPPGAWLAKRMGLEDSAPVYFLQRRRWVDERPVLIELIALDAGWCPGLLDHDLDTSLMSLLRERFGLQPTRCQLAMHPTALNAAQAEPLQLAPGSPALYLERLSYAEGQRVVEFDQEFWRPDALEIVLDAAYPGA